MVDILHMILAIDKNITKVWSQEPNSQYLNIGLANGLALSGSKPLPEAVFTKIYGTIGILISHWINV